MATANTTVALDPELKKKVIAQAKKEQLSLSDVIRFLLKSYVRGTALARPVLTENGFTLEEEKAVEDVLNAQKEPSLYGDLDDLAEKL